MAEVFISYSKKDRARVAPIEAGLRELGVDVWYDIDLSAGETFGDVIETHLKGAKAVLVCWSPEAASSRWVKAEAMYASDHGTYVPIFVARCELKLPFNGIHTDDLSHWTGARDDPAWLKLVARLAEKIGREGVAAGARALAAGDEAAKYAFARRFPDEQLARNIWAGAETRLRAEFASRVDDARAAFEAWLGEERRGAAKGPKPDPRTLVEPKAGGDEALLARIETLSSALAKAKAREDEGELAKAEVERLTRELAGAKAAAAARSARTWVATATIAFLVFALVGLLARDAGAPSSQAVEQLQADLDAANDRIAKLQFELAASPSRAQGAADVAKAEACVPLAPLASRAPGVLSAAEECGLKPKDTFRECANCPTMTVVPAGSFTMGSPEDEVGRSDREGARHQVRIAKPFAVGAFAVTFEEWDACVSDGGCGRYAPSDENWGRGRRPVINVSWNDARAYVAWLSKKTGKPYRLLSESEWEYAARAGATTPFWQGATLSPVQANYDGTYRYNGGPTGEYRKQTVPVGSFAPNGFGLYDMNGNVWQWVADCYREAYRGTDGAMAPADGSEWKTTGDCSRRVVRGGSWVSTPVILRAAGRKWDAPEDRDDDLGFRVARTIIP